MKTSLPFVSFVSLHTLVCALLVGLLCQPVPLWAQSAETLKAFNSDPHLGTLKDALVGITVTNVAGDESVQTRHGNGLMLRCDGFILAPAELFDTRNTPGSKPILPRQSITIVLHPGTDKQISLKGRRPNWYGTVSAGSRRQFLGYAVLKIDDLHCPAMRTLLPDTLQPDDAVTVAWSAWDETTHRFQAVQTQSVKLGKPAVPAPESKTPAPFLEQYTRFAQSLPAMMPGALVVGPEDLVVGMIPGSKLADASQFANFKSLLLATNCVTAVPTPDAAFQPEGMVSVPGGPVMLPNALQEMQLDMEKSRTACVAPFLIDKFEVTNAQYLAFWQSLPDKMRQNPQVQQDLYPLGWGPPQSPFPGSMESVPVLGVRLAGALAYAKWAGKRLPTPYEWCLAAFGPDGGNTMPAWRKKFMEHRDAVWKKIEAAHIDYARRNVNIIPGFEPETTIVPIGDRGNFFRQPLKDEKGNLFLKVKPGLPTTNEFFRLPWFFTLQNPDLVDATNWSKQTVTDLAEPLFEELIDPTYVLPVGSRPYDVSPYGALDMVMNAKELIVPGPAYPWNKVPADVDRYVTVRWLNLDPITHLNRDFLRGHYWGWTVTNQPSEQTIFLQDKLDSPEAVLRIFPFLENDLGGIAWGNRTTDGEFSYLVHGDKNWIDKWGRMSRRILTASENAQSNPPSVYCADLGAFMPVYDSLLEYREVLRPTNTMTVDLQLGPTFNAVTSTATFRHTGQYRESRESTLQTNGKRTIVSGTYVMGEIQFWADATMIAQTSSYNAWSGKPAHYHQEMGRPTGVDHDRPYSERLTDTLESEISLLGTLTYRTVEDPKLAAYREIKSAPDTYLVAGGFRCAR